jgi:hypothetical protein
MSRNFVSILEFCLEQNRVCKKLKKIEEMTCQNSTAHIYYKLKEKKMNKQELAEELNIYFAKSGIRFNPGRYEYEPIKVYAKMKNGTECEIKIDYKLSNMIKDAIHELGIYTEQIRIEYVCKDDIIMSGAISPVRIDASGIRLL